MGSFWPGFLLQRLRRNIIRMVLPDAAKDLIGRNTDAPYPNLEPCGEVRRDWSLLLTRAFVNEQSLPVGRIA
jgi:hypothetical protein